MASFTDTPTNFSPYLSQLPIIEEMSKVGQEKQQQYNQGIQRIQSQIDNVAGLDVIRDVDKQHLRSKLDELGSKLKTVASGDFSNFQLVNSTAGMANQIVKDPNIQNAVASTSRFRQQQQVMAQAKKDGKSSLNREYDFNREASDWLNGDLKHSYNGQFVEHTDVNKKILGIIEKLHPNSNIHDIVNATNPDGSINYGVIADAMHRQGNTGVSEGQIKTAVNSMLDANDMDELASQGRFSYKDYGVNELQNAATENYIQTKASYVSKLDQLNRQLRVTNDIDKQLQIHNDIDYFKSQIGDPYENIPGKLEQSYKSALEAAANNPDAARSSLYTKNYLDQIGNGFAYNDVKDEVLANPDKENYWKLMHYNLENFNVHESLKLRREEVGISKEHLTLAKDTQKFNELKWITEQQEKLSPGDANYTRLGDPTTQKNESLANFANYNNNLEKSNKDILADRAARSKVTDNDILKNIEDYKAGKYKPSTPGERDAFNRYITNSIVSLDNAEKMESVRNDAYKELSGGVSEQQLLNSELSKKSSIPVTQDGKQYIFTPKEIYDYISKERFITSPGAAGASGMSSVSKLSPGENLTDKEVALSKALASRYSLPGVPSKANNTALNNELDSYSEIANKHAEFNNKVNALVAEKMAPITGNFATEQSAIKFKDEQHRTNFRRDLEAIVSANINTSTAREDYQPKTALTLLTKANEKDLDEIVVRKGNQYFIKLLDKEHPSTTPQMIPVDERSIMKMTGLGEKFLNQNLDIAQVMLMNNHTTNESGNYNRAYYHNGLFGGYDNYGNRTVTYPIAADITDDGGFNPIFRILDKKGKTITIPIYGLTSASEFKQYLSTLDDAKIKKLVASQGKDIDELTK